MLLRNTYVQLAIAVTIGVAVSLLPRPQGSLFDVTGDPERLVAAAAGADFSVVGETEVDGYRLEAGTGVDRARDPAQPRSQRPSTRAVEVRYVDGLSPTGAAVPGDARRARLPLRRRADPARDHRHPHRGLPGRLSDRRPDLGLGDLHAPGRGLHHVLPHPGHLAREGRAHGAPEPRHRQTRGDQRRQVHLHAVHRDSASRPPSCTTPPPPPSASRR